MLSKNTAHHCAALLAPAEVFSFSFIHGIVEFCRCFSPGAPLLRATAIVRVPQLRLAQSEFHTMETQCLKEATLSQEYSGASVHKLGLSHGAGHRPWWMRTESNAADPVSDQDGGIKFFSKDTAV